MSRPHPSSDRFWALFVELALLIRPWLCQREAEGGPGERKTRPRRDETNGSAPCTVDARSGGLFASQLDGCAARGVDAGVRRGPGLPLRRLRLRPGCLLSGPPSELAATGDWPLRLGPGSRELAADLRRTAGRRVLIDRPEAVLPPLEMAICCGVASALPRLSQDRERSIDAGRLRRPVAAVSTIRHGKAPLGPSAWPGSPRSGGTDLYRATTPQLRICSRLAPSISPERGPSDGSLALLVRLRPARRLAGFHAHWGARRVLQCRRQRAFTPGDRAGAGN